MLHFEGDRYLPHPPAEMWDRLSDARFLVACIPDVVSVSLLEQEAARCTLRPGFAFVRGTLDLTVQVITEAARRTIRVVLHTKGIGTSSEVETALVLSPQDAGTAVHWAADVLQLGGLLKAVPRGLVQAAAQKVISDAWAAVDAKLR